MNSETNNSYRINETGNVYSNFFVRSQNIIPLNDNTVNFLLRKMMVLLDDILDNKVATDKIIGHSIVKPYLKNLDLYANKKKVSYSKSKIKKIINKIIKKDDVNFEGVLGDNEPLLLNTGLKEVFKNSWFDVGESETSLNSVVFKKEIYHVLSHENISFKKAIKIIDSEDLDITWKYILILANRDFIAEFLTRILSVDLEEFSKYLDKNPEETKNEILKGNIFLLTKDLELRIKRNNEELNFLTTKDKLLINKSLLGRLESLNYYAENDFLSYTHINKNELFCMNKVLKDTVNILKSESKECINENKNILEGIFALINDKKIFKLLSFSFVDRDIRNAIISRIDEKNPTLFYDIPDNQMSLQLSSQEHCYLLTELANNYEDLISCFKEFNLSINDDGDKFNLKNNLFYDSSLNKLSNIDSNNRFEPITIDLDNIDFICDEENKEIIHIHFNLSEDQKKNFEKYIYSVDFLDTMIERFAFELEDTNAKQYAPLVLDWYCRNERCISDNDTKHLRIKIDDENEFKKQLKFFFDKSMLIYSDILNDYVSNGFDIKVNRLAENISKIYELNSDRTKSLEVENDIESLILTVHKVNLDLESIIKANKLSNEGDISFSEMFREEVLSQRFKDSNQEKNVTNIKKKKI